MARYLFTWSGAPVYADFYERAILNGLFGVLRMPLNYEPHQHEDCDHHQHLPVKHSTGGTQLCRATMQTGTIQHLSAEHSAASWAQQAAV